MYLYIYIHIHVFIIYIIIYIYMCIYITYNDISRNIICKNKYILIYRICKNRNMMQYGKLNYVGNSHVSELHSRNAVLSLQSGDYTAPGPGGKGIFNRHHSMWGPQDSQVGL